MACVWLVIVCGGLRRVGPGLPGFGWTVPMCAYDALGVEGLEAFEHSLVIRWAKRWLVTNAEM